MKIFLIPIVATHTTDKKHNNREDENTTKTKRRKSNRSQKIYSVIVRAAKSYQETCEKSSQEDDMSL